MSSAPALQATGLWLRRDGRFIHEGQLVTHRRLHGALLRGVRFAAAEGVFTVQLGRFRGQIEVEDTAFWVTAYDPENGAIDLTDGTSEALDPGRLTLDSDGVLRAVVKRRFPARADLTGQAHLLDAIELHGGVLRLRVGRERWATLPGLGREELAT